VAGIAWTDVTADGRAPLVHQWLAEGRTRRMTFADTPLGPASVQVCDLFTDDRGEWSGLRLTVPDGSPLLSLTPSLPAMHWDEREIQDMFGVVLSGHPDPRPLLLPDAYVGPPPLRPWAPQVAHHPWRPLALRTHGIVHVPVGPVHAGIIESGHFFFSAMGETVLQLDARLSWNHRAVEVNLVGRTLDEAATRVERVCGACSAAHQAAFAQAVEALLAMECDEATSRRRVVILELERISNHLNDLGQLATGVGLHPLAQQGLALKERALRLGAQAFGHRYLFGTIRPGSAAPARMAPSHLASTLSDLARDAALWSDRLFSNVAYRDRLTATGRVPCLDAAALGAVGPVGRASGLGMDVRVDRPYGGYRNRTLQAVVVSEGDALARAEVRRRELVQSFAIAYACLLEGIDATSDGAPGWSTTEASGTAAAIVESPRGAHAHFLRLDKGRVARYHMRPASFSNWPLIMVAARDNPIGDFPLINKSFELCYACADR